MEMIIIKLIIGAVISVFLVMIAKWIFCKSLIRKHFRTEIANIIQRFAPCIQQGGIGFPGNLHEIIGNARDLIKEQNKSREIIDKLNSLFDRLLLLEKRIQFFQDIIKQCYLSSLRRFSQEVIYILSDSAQIFNEFTYMLKSNLGKSIYADISQKLKGDNRGYPAFREKWSDAVRDYKHASREAHEVLRKEIEPLTTFISLPEL